MFALAGLPALAAEPLLPADVSVLGIAYMATLTNGFSIQFDHRGAMQDTSRLFISADEGSYVDVPTAQIADIVQEKLPPKPQPAPAADQVSRAIAVASDKHSLDPDLIHSVIRAESDYNFKAVSPKGARGLMQLMPKTAAKLGVRDAFDPGANVEGGTRYLRELLARFNNDLVKALAAYNAGPQRVEQYHGVPPYRETRAYVSRIIRDYNKKKLAETKALSAKPLSRGKSSRQYPH